MPTLILGASKTLSTTKKESPDQLLLVHQAAQPQRHSRIDNPSSPCIAAASIFSDDIAESLADIRVKDVACGGSLTLVHVVPVFKVA
ncbi:unnamed protein product [Protopolystoma xenopodis]|uniref:Uncharacterized protein n=1 Tax=Protopolystoma xenopodis TaxID=117903 RepID=A0A3S5B953_9PLAT|nr:unnamed protein product [Protopolystoma xenopodis]